MLLPLKPIAMKERLSIRVPHTRGDEPHSIDSHRQEQQRFDPD